ncbi:MAG: phage terminase large subunit [Alphaproteobacteria bacterium]|jgi:hypothetical protein|nr:phage terminase large subunit [Alphaproteobacteria bacterium]
MSRYAIREADFHLFMVLWNQQMKFSTPVLHSKMADWLEWNWKKKNTRLLMMAFRSSGKSTIMGLFAAWLLYRNRDLRILVLAADSILARKMVRQVKKIIETHPLTKEMKPDDPDQWASSRFTVKRMIQLRDPSMLARGITSNITGSRADIVICDDVEVPNTCDTAPKREDLRERLMEMEYILAPGGTQILIGTPHTYYSIYADTPRSEIGEDHEFLKDYERLVVPVQDENGECAWPEKYTPYFLDRIKTQTGPNKFASQMMLRPVNITEGRLDPEVLQVYSHELDYTKEIQSLFLKGERLVGASGWWDPAYGSPRGDNSVFAIVFADEKGNLYLHRLVYLTTNKNADPDEATAQCRQVANIAKENYLPALSVENNGIGKFLPAILHNEMARSKTPCSVKEISNTRPKDIRILEAFDAVLAARRLFVHESVLKTPFMTEMREWRPGMSRGHDDGLDAAAGAISQQPVRLTRIYGTGAQNWMKNKKQHKAETNFEV